MLLRANPGGVVFRQIGVIEQPGLEFAHQHPLDSAVQHFLGNAAGLYGFLQQGKAVGAQIHVHPGVQGHFSGLLQVPGHVVAGI